MGEKSAQGPYTPPDEPAPQKPKETLAPRRVREPETTWGRFIFRCDFTRVAMVAGMALLMVAFNVAHLLEGPAATEGIFEFRNLGNLVGALALVGGLALLALGVLSFVIELIRAIISFFASIVRHDRL